MFATDLTSLRSKFFLTVNDEPQIVFSGIQTTVSAADRMTLLGNKTTNH